jgi:predicted nucleotidyltransferase
VSVIRKRRAWATEEGHVRDERFAPRDRDVFVTVEGWIFTVLGDVHPPKRIWSYLKYVPGAGPWRDASGRTYRRVFTTYTVREMLSIMEDLRTSRPEYVYYDPTVGNEVIAPPVDAITGYWRTSEGLRRLVEREESGHATPLELKALEMVRWLVEQTGLRLEDLGITGSLLLGIHHEKSDVDIVVFGQRNLWKAIRALREAGSPVVPGAGEGIVEALRSLYRMPVEDARRLAARVVHKGLFAGTPYSIFGIRERPLHGYGEFQYAGRGIVEVKLEIADATESLFTPLIYGVEESVFGIERLVSYHMVLAGLLEPGDRLEVRAKLEEVRGPRGEFLQLLLGSYEGVGSEQVKLLR